MITKNTNGTNLSSGFISQIQSDSPNVIARLWYNNAELNCDIVDITVEKGSCGDQTFMVGEVIGDMLTATVKGLSADIKGELIECHIGALVGGSYEYVSLGRFRVSEVKKTRYEAEITAYSSVVADTGTRLDTSGLNNPTIAQIASKVAGKLGCTVTFDTGINTSLHVGAQLDGLTYYQALQVIAICCGGFVVNTYDGNVRVHKFSTTPNLSVNTGMMVKLPEIAEQPYVVDSIGVMVSEATTDNEGNDVAEIFYSDNPSYIIVTKQGTDYYLKGENGNFILANLKPESADVYFSCPYMTEQIFSTNVKGIKGYTYSPATIDLTLGDPRLEGCDVLNVTDVDESTYTVPCHKIVHKYTGGFSSEITSCEASDNANSIGTSFPITQRFETQARQIGTAQATADNAYKIAGDTNQYFWFTGSGSDTGAHITETPQDQFLQDPQNGGGNLLARSNGVAIRDGLEELAIFSADQLRIGRLGAQRAVINSGDMELYDSNGDKYFEVSPDGMSWGAGNDVASKQYVDDAEQDAIDTASADATSKANTAQANAEATASADATAKANQAQANAEKVATNFITTDSTGIKVHNTNDSSNYTHIGSAGMDVYQGGDISASFGASRAQIGKASTGHAVVTTKGMTIYGSDGTVELANIGYDYGNTESGGTQAEAPYYSLGVRKSGSEVGNHSFAVGSSNEASGYGACAEGTFTTASGSYSHAEGDVTTASGSSSHAEGAYTIASGSYSHAEGDLTEASGDYSHAEGNRAVASGNYSHAEGNRTEASGARTHAGGYFTIADTDDQTVVGRANSSDSDALFIVGNGTVNSSTGTVSRSNAFTVDADGDVHIKRDVYANNGTLLKVLKVTKSSVSALPTTISNSGITANMECIHSVLSNPSAQTGDWTVTTSAGSVSVSGSISGTTNITLYLAEPST